MLTRPVVEELDAADGRRSLVAQLAPIELPYMRDLLCRCAVWRQFDRRRNAEIGIDPPASVAQVILHRRGEWTFPPAVGVITTPTMRRDGSLLMTAGYDTQTRLILVDPPPMPPIPATPSREDALTALALLDELLEEFPFADEASRSVALSALITPVVRAALPVAPMHVISAPEAGSGKSYLIDLVAAIAIGQPCPVIAAGRTEEETEKRLGAALLAGQPLVSIDNLNGVLGGDALCQAIERPIVEVRVLGKSELVRIESKSTLFATGNNILVTGDLVRRVLCCRLDPRLERPEYRQFRRRPLAAVLSNRGQYIAAALTLVRAYASAGTPRPAPALASFEGWSNLVRSALLWAGRADPLDTMKRARQEDPNSSVVAALFGAWRDTIGLARSTTASEIVDLAGTKTSLSEGSTENRNDLDRFQYPELRESVLAIAGRAGVIDTREFGKWLSRYRDRVVNGLRLEGRSDRHGHAARWWLKANR